MLDGPFSADWPEETVSKVISRRACGRLGNAPDGTEGVRIAPPMAVVRHFGRLDVIEIMGIVSEIIGIPLGWVMWLCYKVVRNYGVALIIFTLITKMLMFPMSLKRQKSSIKMAMIKPKLDNIQKKYANNKEKLNEEMMKLYQ